MKLDWKQALISILIGACIAFLSTLLDGLRENFADPKNNVLASVGGAAWYFLKKAILPLT